jgi:hypothetical protein
MQNEKVKMKNERQKPERPRRSAALPSSSLRLCAFAFKHSCKRTQNHQIFPNLPKTTQGYPSPRGGKGAGAGPSASCQAMSTHVNLCQVPLPPPLGQSVACPTCGPKAFFGVGLPGPVKHWSSAVKRSQAESSSVKQFGGKKRLFIFGLAALACGCSTADQHKSTPWCRNANQKQTEANQIMNPAVAKGTEKSLAARPFRSLKLSHDTR